MAGSRLEAARLAARRAARSDDSFPVRSRVEAAVVVGATGGRRAAPDWLSVEGCAGGHHRRPAGVHGVEDLAWVDPLQVGAGGPEVRMPELALDDVDRHALTCEFDRVRVS